MTRLTFRTFSQCFVVQFLIFHTFCGADNILTELEDELFVKHDNLTDRATIYTDANFWGIPWSMTITNCTDVPRLLYKKASSINTHGNCFILYGRQDCEGKHVKIAPGTDGHSRLSDVDFDNELASIEPCNSEQGEKVRTRRNINILSTLLGTGSEAMSPENEAEPNRDSNEESENGEGDERRQEDDGAFDTSSFFQNLNLRNLIDTLLGRTGGDLSSGSDFGRLFERFSSRDH